MATPFALLEDRLGAGVTAAFSNASMALPSGDTVDGVLSQPFADGVGNPAMPGRDVVFVCRTSALTVPVAKGTAVSTTYRATTTAWKVVRRGDVLETGDTELQLERA